MKKNLLTYLQRISLAEEIALNEALAAKTAELIALLEADETVVADALKQAYIQKILNGQIEVTEDMLAEQPSGIPVRKK